MITWDDFEKIDMRLGTITAAADFPNARKPSFKLTIDFGELPCIGKIGGCCYGSQSHIYFFKIIPEIGRAHV